MPKDPRPHILLITTDEHRRDALSCYGADAFRTPNIDSIAAGGTRFDRAYCASPLCLPSRCSLLTGLYPHRSGAYSNFRPCALKPEIPNLYNTLRASGYYTAHIGKCHYTPAPYNKANTEQTLDLENVKDFYMTLGLDHLDLMNGKMNSIWFWNDYSRELQAAGVLDAYRKAAVAKQANGRLFPFPGPAELHPDAWIGRKAVEFIRASKAGKPQFMWVSFAGPHYPFDAPEEYYSRIDMNKVGLGIYKEGEWDDTSKIQWRAYKGGGERIALAEGKNSAKDFACKNFDDDYWRRLRRAYFANIVLIDDWVGRILDAAKKKLGDNVMVVFTTDHGELVGNHRLWGKNSCCLEDVLNVPLLARIPGAKTPAASDCRASLLDILPTCLAQAGVEAPTNDGRNLLTSITDGGHGVLFSESDGLVSVSYGRYKYIHCMQHDNAACEFYDLERDPHEFVNAVDDPKYAGEVSRLRRELVAFFVADALK